MFRSLHFTALALLVLAATTPALQADPAEEHALPPAGCWTCDGGGPARTGEARGAVIRGPLTTAWRFTTEGVLESEPLVWGQRVLISVRDSAEQRSLHLLRRVDGVEVGCREFKTDVPLIANVWDDIVLVRSERQQVEALLLLHDELSTIWKVAAQSLVSGILLTEREVWIAEGRRLLRYRLGEPEPTWNTPGTWLGSPSLRGDRIYAVRSTGRKGMLAEVDRQTGRILSSASGEPDSWDIPANSHPNRIAVYDDMVMVHTPARMGDSPGRLSMGFTRGLGQDAAGLAFSWVWSMLGDSVRWEEGFIGISEPPREGPHLITSFPDGHFYPLEIGEFDATNPIFPSRAGTLVFLGRTVIDLVSKAPAFLLDGAVTGRIVPVGNSLLVPRGPNVMEYLTGPGSPVSLIWFAARAGPFTGRVVLVSGTIVSGDFAVDESTGGLATADGKGVWPPSEILIANGEDGSLLACAGLATVPRGLHLLDRAAHAEKLADLADRARSTQDPELLCRIVRMARQSGASEQDVLPANKRIASIRRSRHPRKPVKSKVEAVEAELAALTEPRLLGYSELRDRLGAEAPPGLLLPWSNYFDMSQADLHELPQEPDRAFGGRKVSAWDFFYSQACAACVYLFSAEGGRFREKLMEFAGAYYQGESPRVQDYFGLTPEELGARVRAFSKELYSR